MKIMTQDKECTTKLVSDPDGELRLIYLQTGHIKKNIERNPHTLFVDSTYRTNIENFSLYG